MKENSGKPNHGTTLSLCRLLYYSDYGFYGTGHTNFKYTYVKANSI